MGDTVSLIVDGVEITASAGETIMQAADKAGIYIPRLCAKEGLSPFGACRVCTVLVNGRPQASCIQPVAEGIVVENNTERVNKIRRNIIEMLFVEGNHFCMFCEKSGDCELQALAYKLGIVAPKYPYLFPKREVEASHPDILLDQNRCVLCARCVRASKEIDGKNVFGFVGRGPHKKISVNAEAGLGQTDAEVTDRAADVCPVGTIIKKRTAYQVPIGERTYDTRPIGSDIEAKNQSKDS